MYRNDGWLNWGDWLGTGTEATQQRRYRAFVGAREFVRQLGLRSQTDWCRYCDGTLWGKGKKPDDIPAAPDHVYKGDGWLSWGDWLGTGTVANHRRQFWPFQAARAFARSLGLTGEADWKRYCAGRLPGKGKNPADIPAAPYRTYANEGWLGWGDWLGTGTVAPQLRRYRPFDQARAFARELGLRSQGEWIRYCKGKLPHKNKRPDDIPVAPHRVYCNEGWLSWGDWLGTGTVSPLFRRYRNFRRARAFARQLSLRSQQEWAQYCRGKLSDKGVRPVDIPAAPWEVYQNKGWVSCGDWLGTGFVAPEWRRYRAFRKARAFARRLGLRSQQGWMEYCQGRVLGKGRRPEDSPVAPDHVYRNQGWVGWADWLGTNGKPRLARAEDSTADGAKRSTTVAATTAPADGHIAFWNVTNTKCSFWQHLSRIGFLMAQPPQVAPEELAWHMGPQRFAKYLQLKSGSRENENADIQFYGFLRDLREANSLPCSSSDMTLDTLYDLCENALSFLTPGKRTVAGMGWARSIVDLPYAHHEHPNLRLTTRDYRNARPEELEPADVLAMLITVLKAFVFPEFPALMDAAQDAGWTALSGHSVYAEYPKNRESAPSLIFAVQHLRTGGARSRLSQLSADRFDWHADGPRISQIGLATTLYPRRRSC